MREANLSVVKKEYIFKHNNEGKKLFLIVLPFIAIVFVFAYLPIFGWGFAFMEYKPGYDIFKCQFAGLKYFIIAWEYKKELLVILRNTLALSALGILTSPLPIVLAIMISEVKNNTFKRVVQTVSTIPNFVSWIIIFSLMFSIFSFDGVMNSLLFKLNIIKDPVNVLGNPSIAWYVQTLFSVWKNIGWSAIIYLAAITSINNELYDAAKIDGAGRFASIIHVTVPGIIETYLVLLLLTIASFLSSNFEQIVIFMNPLVADKLDVLDYFVYRIGITTYNYSLSVAISILKSLISIFLLLLVNLTAKRIRGSYLV